MNRKLATIIALPLTLIAGVTIGAATTPEKIKEVEKRVEVPVDKIVEKRVEVPVTPKACITALELGDQGFAYAAEAMGYMQEALTAAGNIDVDGLKAASGKLDALNPKMKALTEPAQDAKAECRAN